ncbi:MAG: hypothetical protein LBM19_03815 [Holosporales bacterium]|nr:hypothetical protein [Holosporales bacterium]
MQFCENMNKLLEDLGERQELVITKNGVPEYIFKRVNDRERELIEAANGLSLLDITPEQVIEWKNENEIRDIKESARLCPKLKASIRELIEGKHNIKETPTREEKLNKAREVLLKYDITPEQVIEWKNEGRV